MLSKIGIFAQLFKNISYSRMKCMKHTATKETVATTNEKLISGCQINDNNSEKKRNNEKYLSARTYLIFLA